MVPTDVVITDFGLSKFAAPHEAMKAACGTLSYVAPEVLRMEGYGKEVDLWSTGVIMFLILRAKLPFYDNTKNRVKLDCFFFVCMCGWWLVLFVCYFVLFLCCGCALWLLFR